MAKVVIVGNGVAGISAARHIRKLSEHEILVISGESDYFFSRTALMYVYMGHMKFEHTKPYEDDFWSKNRIDLKKAWVKKIDVENQQLVLDSQEIVEYDKLILASGSTPRMFDWPGTQLNGVSGLYHLQDLERIESLTKDCRNAAIVGGGLIGIELAEMLHSRGVHVTFLVREKNFWDVILPEEESKMINQEIIEHGIDLLLETELKAIMGDDSGNVTRIITSNEETINASFVGITVGVEPNASLIENSGIDLNRGILVNEYLESSVDNVYAIGDCAELRTPRQGRKSIEPVWYTGRMMGEVLAHTICENRTAYNPGIWFNSAKFFNLEYQTYGQVSHEETKDEKHFLWQSDDGKRLVRMAYNPLSQVVMGVNTMGVRMRHEVWDHWLNNELKIEEILPRLSEANFDPEFSKRYESQIQSLFDQNFSDEIVSKP